MSFRLRLESLELRENPSGPDLLDPTDPGAQPPPNPPPTQTPPPADPFGGDSGSHHGGD